MDEEIITGQVLPAAFKHERSLSAKPKLPAINSLFSFAYNHPKWSLENYPEYIGYKGMHAMEIVNYGCYTEGFNDYNPEVYDDFLKSGQRIYAIAADDNHNFAPLDSPRCDSFGGFTMIKADKLDYKTVTDAMLAGNFYASMGPQIYELYYEDGSVTVTCSDAVKIQLETDCRAHRVAHPEKVGETINKATFKIWNLNTYFRITVTDKEGKHACTNAYFLDQLGE